jgi:hypothetical protein
MGVEERFAPPLEHHGFHVFEIGSEFPKIFEGHILPGHAVVPFAAAHFAAEGAAGGQFDLPGGKRLSLVSPEEPLPKRVFHSQRIPCKSDSKKEDRLRR